MKYKVGQMVKVRDDLEYGEVFNSFCFSGRMYKNRGKVCKVIKVYDHTYIFSDGTSSYTDEMLIDLTDTDFYEGCEIKSWDCTNKVLVEKNGCFLLSMNLRFNEAGSWYTKQELIDQGYKIKDFKPKEPIKQMTIEEAEKAFNIKIVEDVE